MCFLVHGYYFVAVLHGAEMAALVINVPFESRVERLSFYIRVSCLGLITLFVPVMSTHCSPE